MRVLRANRDSLMAVLEAFVFDPLVSWLYLQESEMGIDTNKDNSKRSNRTSRSSHASEHAARWSTAGNGGANVNGFANASGSKPDTGVSKTGNGFYDIVDGKGWQTGNPKARAIIKRILDKLVGTDFSNEQLSVSEQIDKLVQQATSSENLAVLYVGWVPLW
ncbi:hypothetical protein GGF43_004046 [Coemansia sp. RSA 2618]|nr:hypothetical protein GGF43_004046 [Coemansia sp. RSA 2618]